MMLKWSLPLSLVAAQLTHVGHVPQVIDYLQKVFAKRGSPNKLNVRIDHGSLPWLADYNNVNFKAGSNAMKMGSGPCLFHYQFLKKITSYFLFGSFIYFFTY